MELQPAAMVALQYRQVIIMKMKTKKFKTEEIISENGKVVTDEMIENWEACLEKDKWPQGWTNVGEIFEGKLPKSSVKISSLD